MRRHGNRIKQKLRARIEWEVQPGETAPRERVLAVLFRNKVYSARGECWLFGESKNGDLQRVSAVHVVLPARRSNTV